jgi:hypothetical protein
MRTSGWPVVGIFTQVDLRSVFALVPADQSLELGRSQRLSIAEDLGEEAFLSILTPDWDS